MANRRTQEESEKPVKTYQLDAVEEKVDSINDKMDKLLQQTSGLVTTSQLSQAEKEIREKIKEEVEKINLEYGPMKRNADWLFKTVVGLVLTALIEGGGLIYITVIHR